MKRNLPPFLSYFILVSVSLAATWILWLFFDRSEIILQPASLVEVPTRTDNAPVVSTATITPPTTNEVEPIEENVGIANPASQHCVDVGGSLQIKTAGDGGQFGLCYFEDNRACEEWALYRGDCPIGGRRKTGYDTEAQSYCAWLGGTVLAEVNAICTLPDGITCLAADLYQGYGCGDSLD